MQYEAYVDGSYAKRRVGYGAVLLKDGEPIEQFSGEVTEDTSSRQVAGELVAVMTVITYCEENAIDEVAIYYDYTGIKNWAVGAWKTNKALTQRYAAFMKRAKVRVRWHKVKAHSGNRWNDVADELAKAGTGITDGQERQPASIASDPLLLSSIAETFTTQLRDSGLDVQYDRVYNDQYARIIFFEGKKRVGYFDLYNTKNRPLKPHLHGFDDSALRQSASRLWESFRERL